MLEEAQLFIMTRNQAGVGTGQEESADLYLQGALPLYRDIQWYLAASGCCLSAAGETFNRSCSQTQDSTLHRFLRM